MPRAPELGDTEGTLPRASEEAQAATARPQTSGLRWHKRTCISVVLSHPACSTPLQRPADTNTPSALAPRAPGSLLQGPWYLHDYYWLLHTAC